MSLGVSMPLLLVAAFGVAVIHSIMPDHWVPLALVARQNRWSLGYTARVSLLAAGGHVLASVGLGLVLAAVGAALRRSLVSIEGHVVGGVLIATGIGFLAWWALTVRKGEGHGHAHGHVHAHAHAGDHIHHSRRTRPHGAARRLHPRGSGETAMAAGRPGPRRFRIAARAKASRVRGLSAIIVPFGVAASPDLTILPVFLAAAATGFLPAVVVLLVFTLATCAVFCVLTVLATAGGYLVEWPWLERSGNLLSGLLLLAIGVLAYLRL